MLKEPPVLKMVFCSARYDTLRNHFRIQLGEFKIEIKNILEHESGAHLGLIHEKNQRPKISCYCTFKVALKTHLQYVTENLKQLKVHCFRHKT
jgi:hypothetical protein